MPSVADVLAGVGKGYFSNARLSPPNNSLEQTAGSHSLAVAAQRKRSAIA